MASLPTLARLIHKRCQASCKCLEVELTPAPLAKMAWAFGRLEMRGRGVLSVPLHSVQGAFACPLRFASQQTFCPARASALCRSRDLMSPPLHVGAVVRHIHFSTGVFVCVCVCTRADLCSIYVYISLSVYIDGFHIRVHLTVPTHMSRSAKAYMSRTWNCTRSRILPQPKELPGRFWSSFRGKFFAAVLRNPDR